MKLSNNKMNKKKDAVLVSEYICQMHRFYHTNKEEARTDMIISIHRSCGYVKRHGHSSELKP